MEMAKVAAWATVVVEMEVVEREVVEMEVVEAMAVEEVAVMVVEGMGVMVVEEAVVMAVDWEVEVTAGRGRTIRRYMVHEEVVGMVETEVAWEVVEMEMAEAMEADWEVDWAVVERGGGGMEADWEGDWAVEMEAMAVEGVAVMVVGWEVEAMAERDRIIRHYMVHKEGGLVTAEGAATAETLATAEVGWATEALATAEVG